MYSPHTACDAAVGGVNDWIAKGLGDMWSCTPIVPSAENPMEGIGRIVELSEPYPTLSIVIERVKKHFGIKKLQIAVGMECTFHGRRTTSWMCPLRRSRFALVLETMC